MLFVQQTQYVNDVTLHFLNDSYIYIYDMSIINLILILHANTKMQLILSWILSIS